MGYRDLYEHCQTLTPHIKRNLVRDKVLALTGIPQVAVVATGVDVTICRGYYLSARNQGHRLVQQNGRHVIVLARGLNRCWERFIFTKELMHLFDDPAEATDSGEAFETVLAEFGPSKPDLPMSPQMRSELRCFWMALAVLCPEKCRRQFASERDAKKTDDYAIALQLRIPQLYVQQLFRPDYLNIVNSLTWQPTARMRRRAKS